MFSGPHGFGGGPHGGGHGFGGGPRGGGHGFGGGPRGPRDGGFFGGHHRRPPMFGFGGLHHRRRGPGCGGCLFATMLIGMIFVALIGMAFGFFGFIF